MAIRSKDLKPYIFVSEKDTEEPKTKWHVIPFTQWDCFEYQDVDEDSFKGIEQKKMIEGFFCSKIVLIENFELEGKLQTIEKDDIQTINIEQFPLESVLEVYADAISRIEIDEEEAKNSE